MENIKVVNDASPIPSRREGSKMNSSKVTSKFYGNATNYMSNKDEGSDLQQEERREISLNLNMLRKKFDEFREAAAKKEKEIAQMRDEIEKLKVSESGLQDDTSRYSTRLEQLKNSLDMAKMKLEEAAMSKKTYDHMLERMKRDQLSYKLKSSKLETNLASVAHNYNTETEKARKHQQAYLESQFALDHLMKNIESENKQIEDNLENFKGILKTKKASEEKREERIRHQQNVAETAATNKDSTERKWRKLLLVHKFLSVFLKRNMEREMSKYKVVEQAFQKIRAATAINDANEFVTKFLSRENTYSQLLISIAEYEQKLEELRKINETQKNTIASLKNDTVFQDQGPDKRIMTAEIDKEFSSVSEKAKITKTTFEKVYLQGVKFVKKLSHAGLVPAPSSGNLYENYPREKVADLYKLMETAIMPQLEELPDDKVDKFMSEVKRVPANELKTEDFKKTVRIKAPSRQDSAHRSRSNSGRLDTDGSKGNLELTNEGARQVTDENDDYLHEQRSHLKAEIDITNKKRRAERPPSTNQPPARGAPQARNAADVSKHAQ